MMFMIFENHFVILTPDLTASYIVDVHLFIYFVVLFCFWNVLHFFRECSFWKELVNGFINLTLDFTAS